MDEFEASAVVRGDDGDEECPICLAPLPPFWETDNRVVTYCCGKDQCQDCEHKRRQYLERACADGTFGREEVQLQHKCSLCRTQLPQDIDGAARMMLDNLENGRLPMRLLLILGSFYMEGRGVEQNKEKGVEIWTLGAEKGDSNCNYSLGVAYYNGHYGLPKSSEEARRWFLAATEQGHAKAEFYLAQMSKCEGNDPEHLRYLRDSSSKGCDHACYNLGQAHYYGTYGAQKSTDEAIRVLTPAAERGHASSMCLLGAALLCCPLNGAMLPPSSNPNFTNGIHWLKRAAEKGDQKHVAALRELEQMASNRCFNCNKEAPPGDTFLRCSNCRVAWYCSKGCQRQHWKAEEEDGRHSKYCIKWRPKE